jgi:cobyrinic acid a,c-diamide synthase
LAQQIDALAKLAEDHLTLDRLLAQQCGLDLSAATIAINVTKPRARIGVARDAAFTFYYEDNLDLLRAEGAEIVPFSPMHDNKLPLALDALYLGGGYPELHAAALSGNTSMLNAIRAFAASQRPIYAECGGMMYLADSLTTKDDQTFSMAGALPLQVEMTSRLVRFGYVTVEFTRNCLLGPAGTKIRGHSFHYSNIAGTQSLSNNYRVDYSLSGQQEAEGFGTSKANILASYIHLHFRANPIVVNHFIAAAVAAIPKLV